MGDTRMIYNILKPCLTYNDRIIKTCENEYLRQECRNVATGKTHIAACCSEFILSVTISSTCEIRGVFWNQQIVGLQVLNPS